VILALVTFGLITLVINLLGYPQQTITVVYIIALAMVLDAFITMLYSIFQAYEKMEYNSLGQVLNAALILGGVIFAVKSGFGVVGFALIYFLSNIIVLGYSSSVFKFGIARPAASSTLAKTKPDWIFWKDTLKQAWPFGLSLVFGVLFYWIDSVMLSVMKGDAVVGWYNAAYRMMLFLLFIPQAFISALYPVTSKLYMTSRDALKASFVKSFKYMAILGVPIGVGGTILAQNFILLIFGAEYQNSVMALQILVWSLVFIFLRVSFGNLYVSSNRQKVPAWVNGLTAIVNVILNVILIPPYSLIGASIATVLSALLSFALYLAWSLKTGTEIPYRELTSISIKVMITSALMAAFVLLLHNLTLLALVPLAILFYFAALYFIKGIDRDDINMLIRIWKDRTVAV
jgi:O-antigen/teichoic acid export membrane protein